MSGTITHSWNGTVLTITSDSGTSSADLKGDTGIRGAQGAPGIPGESPVIDTSNFLTKDDLPTAEDINAAPSGYGLGEYIGGYTVLEDANTAALSGWYRVASTTKNYGLPYGIMRVEALTSSRLIQTAITAADAKEYRRSCINGVWSNWQPLVDAIGAKPADWMPTAEEVGARGIDWMPTAEELGAAPNGYGLGEYVATKAALSDANTALLAGWYVMGNTTENGVGAAATLIVDGYGSKYTTQTAIIASTGEMKVRHLINEVWGDWKPILEEIKAAPAGYGLGTIAKVVSNPNDIKATGFYSVVNADVMPTARWWSGYHIKFRDEGYDYQYFYDLNKGYVVSRYNRGAEGWSEWEWHNPPMVQGVEYRTTERFNGSPVYAKVVGIGYLTKGDNAIEHNIAINLPIEAQVFNNNQEWLTLVSLITNLSISRTHINLSCTSNFGNIVCLLKYTK